MVLRLKKNTFFKKKHIFNSKSSSLFKKIKYSFLSDYVKAVNALNISWSVYEGDFFPYYDGDTSFWTGYYTSRPSLKL